MVNKYHIKQCHNNKQSLPRVLTIKNSCGISLFSKLLIIEIYTIKKKYVKHNFIHFFLFEENLNTKISLLF